MSYDISLTDPTTKETLELDAPHQIKGGIYALGGTREASLNVTYNYADWYYMDGVFPKTDGESEGIRSIYGKSGAESIPILKAAIAALENCNKEISEEKRQECEKNGATGYWMPTRENAVRPLYGLLAFAQMRPDGIWVGD